MAYTVQEYFQIEWADGDEGLTRLKDWAKLLTARLGDRDRRAGGIFAQGTDLVNRVSSISPSQ